MYQCLNVLTGGDSPDGVGEAATAVWQALHDAEVEVPPEKCQKPSREVELLSTWWIAGSAEIPPDTLRNIEQLQMPRSRKEWQPLMGTLRYCRQRTWILHHCSPIILAFMKGKTVGMES